MCPDIVDIKFDVPMDSEFELSNERFKYTPAGKAYWEGVALMALRLKVLIDKEILDNIYKEANEILL